MKYTKDYNVIPIGEFFERSEVDNIDEMFYSIKKESAKRAFMLNKSLTEYLKNNINKKSKYDVLKTQALI